MFGTYPRRPSRKASDHIRTAVARAPDGHCDRPTRSGPEGAP